MKYRIKKETKPRLSTFGKYKAVAVHPATIGIDKIAEEVHESIKVLSPDVIEVIMKGMFASVNRHLRKGEKVRLDEWGMMKLEIESDKVDDPNTFRAKKHIRGVRLHFIPESYEGSQPLYEGITFEKDKIFKEE